MGYTIRKSIIEALTELANEIKITGKIPDWQKQIIHFFVEFLKQKHNVTVTIEIHVGLKSKKHFGYADFVNFQKGRYKIVVADTMVLVLLKNIAHEFTHLVQFLNKELQVNLDDKTLIWQNESYMPIQEYNKIKYSEYVKIPWEIEAIQSSTSLVEEFKTSNEMQLLKQSDDATIKYLVHNDMLL